MGARYQVIAECAHVPVTDHSGVKATHLLYKGAFLPDGVDPKRLKFLVDGGFVEDTSSAPIAPNASVDQDPARGLDSVTTEALRGEPAESRDDSGSDVSGKVADAVRAESGVDKAVEAPREASDDSEVEARRADARAKLAELGGTPNGRSSDAVMVEFLVGQGYDRAAVESADRSELKSLVEQAKQS